MGIGTNKLEFDCDWRFGFNINSKGRGTVGYLFFWSGCGGLNLKKDIEVWRPYEQMAGSTAAGTLACIGLIETLSFGGGEDDPIKLSAYVSKDTAADISAKLVRPLPSTKVKALWKIVNYDAEKKTWYEAARTRNDAKVDANVDTAKGVLHMTISSEPTPIAPHLDLAVFKFEFQLVPASNNTALLEFATGPTQKLVRKWGS